MSDGTSVCSWCGGQTRMLGQRPTSTDARDAEIAVYSEDGVLFVGVDFPDGRQSRHYLTRIPAQHQP